MIIENTGKMNNLDSKKLNDSDMAQVSGGKIYGDASTGKFFVFNENTGEQLESFDNLSHARQYCKDNNISTEATNDPNFINAMYQLRMQNNK